MTTARIRQRLHEYIDTAQDKKLKAIYTLLQDEIDYEGHLTKEQMAELDRRLENYQNGYGKTYTWKESVSYVNEELVKYKSRK